MMDKKQIESQLIDTICDFGEKHELSPEAVLSGLRSAERWLSVATEIVSILVLARDATERSGKSDN